MSKFPFPEVARVPQSEFEARTVSGMTPKGGSLVSKPGGAKFPRRLRLLRHADFDRVYKQGRRCFAAHMTVFYLVRLDGQGPRVGFTVGRVLGDAVVRNRIKRRLRETVRLRSPRLTSSVDVVINPKKSLLTAEFVELQKEINTAFDVIQKSVEKQAGRG